MSRPDWRIFNSDQPKVKKGRQWAVFTIGLKTLHFCMDNSRTYNDYDWVTKRDTEGMEHGTGYGQERKRRGIRASWREHMDLPL